MYLHFGQNRGKSSNTVCDRTCVLVLPPHLGQQSQSVLFSSFFTTWDHLGSLKKHGFIVISAVFAIKLRNAASLSCGTIPAKSIRCISFIVHHVLYTKKTQLSIAGNEFFALPFPFLIRVVAVRMRLGTSGKPRRSLAIRRQQTSYVRFSAWTMDRPEHTPLPQTISLFEKESAFPIIKGYADSLGLCRCVFVQYRCSHSQWNG